jgi:hypothetical protein
MKKGEKKPTSGRRGAPRNEDGSFKSKAEDPNKKNAGRTVKGRTSRPSDKTIAKSKFLPTALFNSANIDLNHPIEGQKGRAVETYGDVIMRAANKGRAYNIDPMFEVVTQEAAFVRTLVESMMNDDLTLLSTLEKAKVVDQITRSFDTILRGIEFAQGRADSRPEVLLKQATMEMLNDEELASMEAMYVKAHRRVTTSEETHVQAYVQRLPGGDIEPQTSPRQVPFSAVEPELGEDDYPRGADPDEPRESSGGYRSDYDRPEQGEADLDLESGNGRTSDRVSGEVWHGGGK